jgi:hypothetical protein
MLAAPVREIAVPDPVGWHARVVSFEQQSWLIPPLPSTHTGFPVTGSVPMVAHAPPLHCAEHVPAPH